MSREAKWKAEMRLLRKQTISVVAGDFYHIQPASALCIYQSYFLDSQRTHTATREAA